MAQSYVALGRFSGAESKAEAAKTAGILFPLTPAPPLFSPSGEGETFTRRLVIRPILVIVCLRNERQRSGDCNCNVRAFQRCANALPLLWERVGVRGNEATSNPRRMTISGTVKLRESLPSPWFLNLVMNGC